MGISWMLNEITWAVEGRGGGTTRVGLLESAYSHSNT